MNILLLPLALTLLFSGCGTESQPPASTIEEIKGRDNIGQRTPIYRARVPHDWIRYDSLPDETITDTTKALCEFIIPDSAPIPSNPIRIAIHNFPYASIEQQIPPQAQVARWERQFDTTISHMTYTKPQSFSGYIGILFVGVGVMKGQDTMVMGWALQIPAEHYSSLTTHSENDPKQAQYLQMRADVTIKATGPIQAMEEHRDAITAFARSFELIEEIPIQP